MLIINADDWGATNIITQRIHRCFQAGAVDSVSAMVYMGDSERAAELAKSENLDTGLHVNFTEPFTGKNVSAHLQHSQEKIIRWLMKSKFSQVIYNPFLKKDFEYVFKSQYQEYTRLYNKVPSRIDGHNHMHLCANMLFSRNIPEGTIVRKNITFTDNQNKSRLNKLFRKRVDSILKKRFICTDYFFHIRQITSSENSICYPALNQIIDLAERYILEVLAHPGQQIDSDFLTNTEFLRRIASVPRCSFANLHKLL
ncbi:MAG: ChbG/HpnK family deacetylase [Fibrobacter sp.]|jgi:predicted glycoside hydrolase/deacetylase ChbG (UPF0249 family)|nr:ChbG/HpnK family deacetylase [Fibrobacter sp.]